MRPAFVLLAALAFAAPAIAQQTPRPINNGGLPSVSPDGKRIAFMSNRDGTYDIYVIEVEGGRVTRLTNTPENEGVPRWLSNGKVVYSTWASDTTRVYSVNADGTGATPMATIPQTRGPFVSPDGKKLLYALGRFPRTVLTESNIDGSGARRVFADTTGLVFSARWSPDANRIAYTRADTMRGPLNVWVANADGSNARRITNLPDAEGSPEWPDWSPDGRLVAVQVGKYNRTAPNETTAHVWIIDPNGTARKLAPHDAPYLDETPSWFPDGKRLAIQSNRTGRMEIWIVTADGKSATQLTR
jgi:Tol biopolymer transport system component